MDKETVKTSLNGYRLEAELKNVPISFVNALRRILLSEIPTVVVSNVVILENTTSMTHEMLRHRIEMLPVNVQVETIDVIRDTSIELKVGIADKPRDITTADFTIGPKAEILLLDRDLGTPLYFMTLKPNESIHIKASLSIETKGASQVCVSTFSNHIDEKQRQLDRDTWIAEGNDPDVFDNLHYQRSYARDNQGRPYWFDFTVESIGVTKASDLVKRAVEVLQAKVKEFAELPIQREEPNWYRMEMPGETFTIGQLVQEIIYGTQLTEFVSRDTGHPLIPRLTIRFNTKIEPEKVVARFKAEADTLCENVLETV